MFKSTILSAINQHSEVIKKINVDEIEIVVGVIIDALNNGSSIHWCGNGGSASQANHLSAELVGGMHKQKNKPLKSTCLNVDTAFITAWSNDDNFDNVFSRQIESTGNAGDILITLTTSGNSKNILNAISKAKKLGLITISFTGNEGGEAKMISDYNLNINHKSTARIQEMHILIGHIICDIVESECNLNS